MKRIALWLGIGLASVLLVTSLKLLPALEYQWAVDHARSHGNQHADLYHKYTDQPCRAGYLPMPRAFGRGHETWDGCWDGYARSMTIDFLLDDEDVALGAIVRR